jgi:transposase
MFSFEEILKYQPETRLQKIFSVLGKVNIVSLLPDKSRFGRKGYDREAMFYAIVAMYIENIKTVSALVARLRSDPVFRYTCGFNVIGKVPSESTFSRFLAKLLKTGAIQKVFETLVVKAKELNIIDGTNIAIDSTEYEAYDTPLPKSKIVDDGKSPNWGKKKDSHGNDVKWFGWKLHLGVDCESELPVSLDVTPASVNDAVMAIPLAEYTKNTYGDLLHTQNYIFDSIYDTKEIYSKIYYDYGAQAIIPLNHRSAYAPPAGLDYDGTCVCSMGYRMVYWGYDKGYHKFRCPHVLGKVDCPFGSNWCSSSSYGLVVKKKIDDDPRLFTFPHRCTQKWKDLYNMRTAVERCFSRLKEYLGLNNLTLKGIEKAKLHATLCCIALISCTIAINVDNLCNLVA